MPHSHGHTYGDSHGHHDLQGRNLVIVTILNLVITLAEFVGGVISNSLALISDAVHNLGDTIAIFLALIANKIGKRTATEQKTFGYKRVEILTALFNSITLIVISIFLFKEAYERFIDPKPIKGLIMFVAATIGLLANLYSVIILQKYSKENLNIKAAYLHLLGDTISSVAVIIGAILIYFFNVYWIDPIITVIIGIYIIREAIVVVREAVDVLMMAAPKHIDIKDVKKQLEKIQEVNNIHHIHIWQLADHKIHFECHADIAKDVRLSQTSKIQRQLESTLQNNYGISHVTIQMEHDCCADKEMIHNA